MIRVNLSLTDDILARIDVEAEHRHMTRSAYIRMACDNQTASDELLRMSPDLKNKMLDLQNSLSTLALSKK